MQQTKEMTHIIHDGHVKSRLYALALSLVGVVLTSPAQAQNPLPATSTTAQAVATRVTTPTEITKMDVVSDETGTRIILVGKQAFTPTVQTLGSPTATVITIPGRWNAGRKGILAVRKNGVNSIRAGQFSDRPEQVRIVANTRVALGHVVKSSADKTRWEILFEAPAPAAETASKPIALSKPILAPTMVQESVHAGKAEPGPYPALLAKALPLQVAGTKKAVVNVETRPEPVKAAEFHPVAFSDRAVQEAAEEGRRVSLDFVAADINDVLKALSLQSGINIVTSTDVKGTVTCSMRRVSFREALDTVVNLSGYKYGRVGNTYAVGTPEAVAGLVRGSSIGNQVTSSIPFIFSDGPSLKEAIEIAYPIVKGRVALVTVGSEGKTANSNAVTTGNGAAATQAGPVALPTGPTAGPRPQTTTTATERQIVEKVVPKGGVISVTGTQGEVESVRTFIDDTERALLEAPAKEAAAKARENQIISARATEVYTIRYASPIDLMAVLNRLVPSVSVHPGPAQGFQPATLGGSASYTTGGKAAETAAGGGGTSSDSSSPAGAGAGSNTSGLEQNPSGKPSDTLLLTGTAEAIARAREVLTQVDIKVPQLAFEARVVDSTMDDLRQIGFNYDFSQSVTVGEINTGTTNLGSSGALKNSREAQFGAIFRSPYSATVALDALETKGRVKTLARPNLSALDGQAAVVFIGDQVKYIISIQQTQQGQSIQTETATVGITLRVSGKTSPDGHITVYVHPEVSVISGYLNLNNGIALPQIATRFVDTTVRIKDGETFALAGLMRQQDVDNIQKVPFLGDLPFFGNLLFKSRDKQRHNSEVVILITTRILKD